MAKWPLTRTRGWVDYVNKATTDKEVAAWQRSVRRGYPFGDDDWTAKTVKLLGLESTVNPRGRPKKVVE